MEKRFFLPSTDPHDPNGRLAIYVDGDGLSEGLIDIADEDCTSSRTADVAEPLISTANALSRVCISREQAAWLRDVLIALDLGPAPSLPSES